MKIVVKPSFMKDLERVRNKEIKFLLNEKLNQIEKAATTSNITGLKLLRGFKTHYRIKVDSETSKYRIGAIIRKEKIWLVRFLPRKEIYLDFP